MNVALLILALLVAGALSLTAVLLVPAWLLQRFLCVAHASARRELLASRQSPAADRALRLIASNPGS